MTTTLDLRTAFARHYYAMPDRRRRPERAFENDVDDATETAGGKGKGSSGGGSRDDGSSDTDDTDEDASSSFPSGRNGANEEIRDPEGYVRSAEAAKYRKERNEARTQLEEMKRKLEGKQSTEDYESTIRNLRLELAFERMATTSRINDVKRHGVSLLTT